MFECSNPSTNEIININTNVDDNFNFINFPLLLYCI